MMHVTPMWIPMMMPVVEVLLFCSSFMQSQGGFSTARKRRRGQWCYSSIAPLASGELRAKVRALGSAGSCAWEEENHMGSRSSLPACAAPYSQHGRHSKHRTGISVVSQLHYLATVMRHN